MRALRVLLVDDAPNDAELICLALQRGGYEPRTRRVQTAGELRAALAEQAWDVVLSDAKLAAFSAADALALVRERGLDLPFLIVSDPMGEEAAVQAMRAGVHDCLRKDDLGHLAGAVERELREAQLRIERRGTQEQLLIAERMAWVAAMGGGLVHEINNPLAVICGNLEVLQRQFRVLADKLSQAVTPLPDDAAAAVTLFDEAAADTAEAARRVELITRELRRFCHPDEEKADAIDVHQVLEWSIRMTQNATRSRFELVRRFGMVPAVEGRTAALAQVFANLLMKATQTSAESPSAPGPITLATSSVDGMIAVDVIAPGGIQAAALPRIFGIVAELGGRVEVQADGCGATQVRVLLRPIPGSAAAKAPATAPPVAVDPRSASILVIEDEPALRRVLPRLLAPHSVTVVERAVDALERLRTGGRFDVILCDIMMPEMDGMQFHQELARDLPDIARRVIFMSGGVFSPTIRTFFDALPNRRLEKPLDIPALRRLIDETAWS
jgi:CheY-like chemotaxis protein